MPRLSKKNLKSKKNNKRNSNKRLRVSSRKNTKRTTLRGGSDTIKNIVKTYSGKDLDFFTKKAEKWQNLIKDPVVEGGEIDELMRKLYSKRPFPPDANFTKLEELVRAAKKYFKSLENSNTDPDEQTITYEVNVTKQKLFNQLLSERLEIVSVFESPFSYIPEWAKKYLVDEAIVSGEFFNISYNSNNNGYQTASDWTGLMEEYKAVVLYLEKVKKNIEDFLEYKY